jgi:hypothetical protein
MHSHTGCTFHVALSTVLQLMVEQYFVISDVLSSLYYWLGARRLPDLQSPLVFVPFANMSGGELAQSYSASNPYAHWASYHYQQAAAAG